MLGYVDYTCVVFGLLRYGVRKDELQRFVEENEIVKSFLNKYNSVNGKGTYYQYAYSLCRYFKWLRMVKNWNVSPKDLLNDQIRRQSSTDVQDRSFHVKLALEHSRDNPDFKDFSDSRKYSIFVAIRNFYAYYEVPLTRAKGIFGKRKKRKHYRKQMNLTMFKKIFGVLEQRERTIVMIIFQSGMEIGAVLNKFSYMWPDIKAQLQSGKERIKIEFDERKGNDNWYFTYISTDAIHELEKWLVERKNIVEQAKERFGYVNPKVEAGTPIFISHYATPYKEDHFYQAYKRKLQRYGLKNAAYDLVSHQIRKLFKTEASIPDRAIDRYIVEFWLGHTDGVEKVGAEYDRTPEIYERVIEKEYMKLEPYINIYSSHVAKRQSDPLLRDIEQLANLPFVREVFSKLVADAKAELAEKLELQKIQ